MDKQINYLRKLTDDFGIIQFSNKDNPDIKTGYTIDDVSRALIVSSKLGLEDLSKTYFDFIKNAQIGDGRFVNVYSGERKPLEKVGSEDSFGRTLWALGDYMDNTGKGEEVSYKAVKALEDHGVHWPISESFALLGLTKMYDLGFEKKKTGDLIGKLGNSLVGRAKSHFGPGWFWVSDEMSYENARIPQALLRSGQSIENMNFYDYGEAFRTFLAQNVFERDSNGNEFLNVIGNNTSGLEGTWYKKGFVKPKFDEQPVDAGGMVELYLDRFNIKRNSGDLDWAKISLDWFSGRNRLALNMISPEGGVYDGLNEDRVNPNQGAESLLAYMMARSKFDEIVGKDLYNNGNEREEQLKINENGQRK